MTSSLRQGRRGQLALSLVGARASLARTPSHREELRGRTVLAPANFFKYEPALESFGFSSSQFITLQSSSFSI